MPCLLRGHRIQLAGPRPAPRRQGDEGADETKFDAFLGNDAGVLGQTGVYDEEDREADEVWDHIEDRMDERRKVGPAARAHVCVHAFTCAHAHARGAWRGLLAWRAEGAAACRGPGAVSP